MKIRRTLVAGIAGVMLSLSQAGGQTTVLFQGFEPGGDTWPIAGGTNNISTATGATDTPANQRVLAGSRSWQVNNGNVTLLLQQASIEGYVSRVLRLRLASLSVTSGNGADGADVVRVSTSLDGAEFNLTNIVVAGNSNARWGYTATQTVTVAAGASTSVAAPAGGTSLNNYSTLLVTIPDAATSLAVRVVMVNNDGNEVWALDDIELIGSSGGPATNVQFTAASATVGEGVGTHTVTVYKSQSGGDVSGTLALGGTATAAADYTISTTNFALNGATTSATFEVTIIDDGDPEPAETIVLTLANLAGAVEGSPQQYTLSITDNDTPVEALFISEVSDPSDNFDARFVELYNASAAPINLGPDNWTLSRQSNGSTWGDIPLTGTVAAFSTYVVAFSPSVYAAAYPSAPSPQQSSGSINGNGDDGYFLFKLGGNATGVLIDAYGVINQDGTAQPWEYLDTRAVRTSSVTQANSTWTAAEWTIPASAAVADMTPGVHPDGPPVVSTNVRYSASSDSAAESSGAYTVTVTKSVADGNVSGTVTLGGTAATPADYTIDTTNFAMNGATTSATFVITINDDMDVESAETVTLTLANVTGGTIASPSVFTLTISDNDAPPSTPEGILAFRFTDGTLNVAHNSNGISVSAMSLTSGTIETNITTGTYFPNEPYIEETGGWTNSAQTGAKAYQFTVTPDIGASVTITGFSLRAYATGTGPSAFGASIDGVSVFSADMPDSTIQTISNSFAPIVKTTPFVVSIEGWTNGSRVSPGTGVFRIDDVVLFGVIGAAATPTNVSFAAAADSVGEGHGVYVVTVTKSIADGDVSGSVILGGSAATPGDYTISTTNFTMNGATTSATFNITIADDASVEGVETITLTLADVTGGGIASPSVFTLTINDNDVAMAPSLNVWVNEFHYENVGADVNEGVEIAGPAGTDLDGYSVHYYDGLVGGLGVYHVTNLTGVIPDQTDGYGTLWFGHYLTNVIQNGSADGFALVYGATQVLQLLSYEGTFTATSGPAAGMTSVDIGQQQSNTTTPLDTSLQLCGASTSYAGFVWAPSAAHSRGLPNPCQAIPGPAQQDYIITHWGSLGGYPGNGADDDGDGFNNREEFIAVTTPVPPSGSNSFFRAAGILGGASRSVSVLSSTGRLYRLWSSATLVPTQNWVTVDGPTAGTGGILSLSDGTDTNAASYRLTVELE